MSALDLDSIVDVCWAQFEVLTAPRVAPEPPPEPCDTPTHRCGYDCPHVVVDDAGSYTCTLSGVIFGKQICNGPLDSRLWQATAYFPGKRKRSAPHPSQFEEVFSTSTQTVMKLLNTTERRQADADRLAKALKSAARRAPTLRREEPCALSLMYRLFAEVERGGATTVACRATAHQLECVAGLLTQLYSLLMAPYLAVDPRRPTTAYYAVAMCYLLSTQSLGRRLHVPMLAALLPEEKGLKHLGFSVTRMTSAKRYVLAAVKHYAGARAREHALSQHNESSHGS